MDTNTIVNECLGSLESINTEKEKHLYIFIDHNHGIVKGRIEVEGVSIVSFDKINEAEE